MYLNTGILFVDYYRINFLVGFLQVNITRKVIIVNSQRRVTDFSWFGAGPYVTRLLAAYGAEVIRIESNTRIDGMRWQRPGSQAFPKHITSAVCSTTTTRVSWG
jgi:hypothetical protein